MKSSLDLLDEVIGEFDDGLTSAAESDILLGASVTTPITKRSQRHHRNDRYNDSAQDRISNRINGSNHFNKNGDHKNIDIHKNSFTVITDDGASVDFSNDEKLLCRDGGPRQRADRRGSMAALVVLEHGNELYRIAPDQMFFFGQLTAQDQSLL